MSQLFPRQTSQAPKLRYRPGNRLAQLDRYVGVGLLLSAHSLKSDNSRQRSDAGHGRDGGAGNRSESIARGEDSPLQIRFQNVPFKGTL
jgi:hypothetical protein